MNAILGALNDRIGQAVARLMAASVEGERARLAVPVLYPSGNSAVVEIIGNNDRCFVSDIGRGHLEAEMHGAQDLYAPSAKAASERFGVEYDGLSVFASWAALSNVEGAIAGVANASVQAASIAIFRAMEEKERQRNSELFERVQEIFGRDAVAKYAELQGVNAVWQAHNVVRLSDHRRAVFEFVSEHPNSVSSKFMMFSDLAKKKGAYSLNSVVSSVERLGQKGAMLGDVSHIIELRASRDQFERLAKVA